MSAAAWESITTARKRISNRASTTRCEEYARDVVYHIQSICDEAEVPHPTIITESGRAVAAYHSMLVFNVLGVSGFGEEDLPASIPEDAEQPLIDLLETHTVAHQEKSARDLSRCAAGAGFGAESFQPRLSAAGAAQPGGKFLLGDLPQDSEAREGARFLPGRAGRPGRHAVGYLLLQFFAVSKHAG